MMNARLQITPSRTPIGFREQIPHWNPAANFDVDSYRIVAYKYRDWRTRNLPKFSHFERLHLAWTEPDGTIHVIGICAGKKNVFLKCVGVGTQRNNYHRKAV